jgi:hypothetical protein
MKQGELFLSVCGKLKDTSSSDVDSTVSTSTETTGQTPTNNCKHCDVHLTEHNWNKSRIEKNEKICKSCHNEIYNNKSNPIKNPQRMYVNGKYIPKTHPLYKAGRYKSFDDAAFSGLQNYERSSEGQVYVITNSAWPEWVKIGMAVDAEDRLNGYQTSSPFRNYRLMYSVSTNDRRKAEAAAHKAAEKIADRKGEWFKMSVGQAKECIQNGL